MKKILLLLIVFFVAKLSMAQVSVTNTGVLQISVSTDTFFAMSNFTNNAGSGLTNNGQLYIKGNLGNDQVSMAVGTGTLYLNGGSGQSVNGSQTFKTYNLVTNNSAGFTLNNNLSVSGTHTFTSGLIVTSATPNYLVYEAGSSYTGDNDSRHVNGWVKKYGTTNFTFPVGDATYERTIGITNLSASSEFNGRYYTPTSNIFNLAAPLVAVEANEYWQINKISGGTAKMALNWDNSKVGFNNVMVADVTASQYISSNWTDIGGTPAGNPATTGTVTLTNDVSGSFGLFTFGFKSFPVPLKLISFTGVRNAGASQLHWITENEENMDRFEVQRSYNAITYTTIGAVAARNTVSTQHYDFEDRSPLQGIVYYRIKSIDIDGKFSYSKIIALSENQNPAASFFVLNPVQCAVTIFNKTGHSGYFGYSLFNTGGQVIMKGNVNMDINGSAVLPLPSQTSAGMYLLEMNTGTEKSIQKILVGK